MSSMSFLNSSVTVQEGNEDKQISATDKRVTEQKTKVNVTDNICQIPHIVMWL